MKGSETPRSLPRNLFYLYEGLRDPQKPPKGTCSTYMKGRKTSRAF